MWVVDDLEDDGYYLTDDVLHVHNFDGILHCNDLQSIPTHILVWLVDVRTYGLGRRWASRIDTVCTLYLVREITLILVCLPVISGLVRFLM